MSTPAMIPMVAPDGSVGEVPQDRVNEALSNGGSLGIKMQAPSGQVGIIPRTNVSQAIRNGGKVVFDPSSVSTEFEQDRTHSTGDQIISGVKGLGTDLLGMVAGLGTGMGGPQGAIAAAGQMGGQIGADIYARKQEGRSTAYNAVATTGELLGGNFRGAEEAANVGDYGGVVGHAAAPAVAYGIGKGMAKYAPEVGGAIGSARTSAVRSTVPEAATLPTQAIQGAEQVYRAAAPTGGDPQFRSNVYTAAGDLAEVAQKVNMDAATGGFIQPDMRVRATVNAINDHLSDMYQNERAPQIDRHADNPVTTNFGPDAKAGLEYLARNAGTDADRALAQNALQSGSMPLGQVDELARAVNRELSPLRGMTAQELAVSEGNSRRFAGLQALDENLSDAIGAELQNQGEPGIDGYERRYAALSQVRDQLQSRMNATELQRQVPVVGSLVRSVMGGKAAIAGASQAAVANVNIGAELANGLDNLARSGVSRTSSTGMRLGPSPGPSSPFQSQTSNLSPTNEWTMQAARDYAANPSKGAAYYLRRKK